MLRMQIRSKKARGNIIVMSLAVMLLAMSWVAINHENTLSTDRIKIHRTISLPSTTPDLQTNVLVFFGYVGCQVICTTRMLEITEIYNDFINKNGKDNLSVLFINLDQTYTSKIAMAYAKSYNSHFEGVTYEQQDLKKMVKLFQVSFSHGFLDSKEINHSQFLYLIRHNSNQQYFLNQIFTHAPLKKEQIVSDLEEIII